MCDCSMCMRARELVSFARVREEMPWLWKVCVSARGGWMVTADRANIGHFVSPHGADEEVHAMEPILREVQEGDMLLSFEKNSVLLEM